VAREVFKRLNLNIDLIGISKDHRHKARMLHMSNGEVLDLFKIPNFEIFSKISEEVHRFTIKFHKHKRDKI